MKFIKTCICYLAVLIALYGIHVYFFLHRNWITDSHDITQSEIAYWIQELSNGNWIAYGLVLIDLLVIAYMISCIMKAFAQRRQV